MQQIFLIRHAQASFGTDNYDRLSELGHQQADILGEYFASRNVTFDYLVRGDMCRHEQTAAGILRHQQQVVTETDARFNEFDFEQVVTAYLIANPTLKPADDAPRSQWYKVLKDAMLAWSADELVNLQGETWQQFNERTFNAFNQSKSTPNKKIAIVTSGGVIAMLLGRILGVSSAQKINFNLQIRNTSVTQLFCSENQVQLSYFNGIAHLDTPQYMSKITYS